MMSYAMCLSGKGSSRPIPPSIEVAVSFGWFSITDSRGVRDSRDGLAVRGRHNFDADDETEPDSGPVVHRRGHIRTLCIDKW